MSEKDEDREALQAALQAIKGDLPRVVHLNDRQMERLLGWLDFLEMVVSIKRFGVPIATTLMTLGGLYLAFNQFFGFKR